MMCFLWVFLYRYFIFLFSWIRIVLCNVFGSSNNVLSNAILLYCRFCLCGEKFFLFSVFIFQFNRFFCFSIFSIVESIWSSEYQQCINPVRNSNKLFLYFFLRISHARCDNKEMQNRLNWQWSKTKEDEDYGHWSRREEWEKWQNAIHALTSDEPLQ